MSGSLVMDVKKRFFCILGSLRNFQRSTLPPTLTFDAGIRFKDFGEFFYRAGKTFFTLPFT